MRLLMLFLAGLCALAAACYPVPVKTECQARVSDCLKDCPMAPPGREQEFTGITTKDTRSDCERHCHELCTGSFF